MLEDQLKLILVNRNNESLCGIRGNSILSEIKIFHTSENYIFDIMHNILEGLAPMQIKWVLQHFIKKKYFSIGYLNIK